MATSEPMACTERNAYDAAMDSLRDAVDYAGEVVGVVEKRLNRTMPMVDAGQNEKNGCEPMKSVSPITGDVLDMASRIRLIQERYTRLLNEMEI